MLLLPLLLLVLILGGGRGVVEEVLLLVGPFVFFLSDGLIVLFLTHSQRSRVFRARRQSTSDACRTGSGCGCEITGGLLLGVKIEGDGGHGCNAVKGAKVGGGGACGQWTVQRMFLRAVAVGC